MMPKLTETQIKDIQEREKKALAYLKELQLTPAAVVQKLNIGEDIFIDQVKPYLMDTKFIKKEEIKSPIQKEDLKK